ncbi:unnamed protein product [Euphydryas editha]|uniref:Transposase n=1 Tax=Euphydryas editha TaxID=104508 RepID=A0AAU9U009_EUPED|nr:unnamed protein product [Euphydryas editha]
MVDKVIKASKIIALLEEGCSTCLVAQRLNVSRSTVQRTWQRYQETGSVKRRPGSGRKTCTEPRDDRFLVSQALRNRKSSYVDLKNTLEEVRNVQISLWTVRRRSPDLNPIEHVWEISAAGSADHQRAKECDYRGVGTFSPRNHKRYTH